MVQIPRLPVCQRMGIVRIFRSKSLAEIRVQESRVVVSVKPSGKGIDIVLVGKYIQLVKEHDNGWRPDPSKALFIDHLEGIHEVEVRLLCKGLLHLLNFFFINYHFKKNLNQFSLIVG